MRPYPELEKEFEQQLQQYALSQYSFPSTSPKNQDPIDLCYQFLEYYKDHR